MRSRATRLASVLVFVLLSIGLVGRSAQAQDETLQQAKQFFDEGQNLYLQAQYAEAADLFIKAHQLREFPAFLFNVAVCYEKNRDFLKAIDYYEQFLNADAHGADTKDVQQRINTIKQYLNPPEEAPSDVATEAPAVPDLPKVETKGLVVIESDPAGAAIYLDDRTKGIFTRSPYTGNLPPGSHTVELEIQGYDPIHKTFIVRNDRFSYLYFGLTRQQKLGWIEVKSNVPGALVYLDDKSVGPVGRTPYTGHQRPGKRKIIVEREGYEPVVQELEIEAAETYLVEANLARVRYGWLQVSGETVADAKVTIDGQSFPCGTLPCKNAIAPGTHKVLVERDGYKSYITDVVVNQAEELNLRVHLELKPARTKAYVSFGVAALFLGLGIGAGVYSSNQGDGLNNDAANGQIYDSGDSRTDNGKVSAITANVLYGLSGVTAALGVYFLLRDEGPPSFGDIKRTSIALSPLLGPELAGVGGMVRF